jgi:hypothetical protein
MLKKVKIGPVTYQISPTTNDEKIKRIDGCCSNVWAHYIRLSDWQKGTEAVDTFIHEILHALNDIKAIKLSHRQIYHLAEGLTRVLKDNKDLRIWIDEQLK